MKVQVIFRELNPNFNKDYANEYHFGKESENNLKINWSVTHEVSQEVKKISFLEKSMHTLRDKENNKEIVIDDVTALECIKVDGEITRFAVSNSIIDKMHEVYQKKYNITRFYFYIKPGSDYIELNDCVLDVKSLP